MNQGFVLVQKEWLESLRNGKLIWLPIALCILGISQPLSTYYMPQLLEFAGGLPDGTIIEIPTPSATEVLAGVLSQFGLLGTLLFVLSSMNIISHERNNGSITFIMIRPISSLQYILSKFIGILTILMIGFFLSYILSWYYTIELFEFIDFGAFLSSFFIYCIWIAFVISIVITLSLFLKNGGGIAGASIGILAILALLHMLLPNFMKWSPIQLQLDAAYLLINPPHSSFWGALATTSFLIVVLLTISVIKHRTDYHS
ncbi:ABC transporter permease [Alkalihalobacillus trypoxylicola]|uniref:ABC transporter permease n=1 Tax=Alkalihalobacillus trypoxylicola TaxID=519424 RepID=A0A161P992_9BACI|nr:ABC transporter permease subunit [Alkalihalobacillus trypoxylicola]KYG27590.1 hypothetical protein AZF04_10365 [Alkalihalobacillus trypoxylicola]